MSTGENLNANGSVLSADIVRRAFHRFPQSELAWVAPDLWPQIAPLQVAPGNPFSAVQKVEVPPGEIWFVDRTAELVGRIVNLAIPPAPVSNLHITSATSTQNGANYTVTAAWTNTPNVPTSYEIWTTGAKGVKMQIVDSGTLVNGAGSYTITSKFKADPHANIFFTVSDALGGNQTVPVS